MIQLPKPLQLAFSYFLSDPVRMREQGIFRKQASLKQINQAMAQIHNQNYDAIHSQADPHFIAGLITTYFTQQPQSLLPYQLFLQNHDALKYNQIEKINEVILTQLSSEEFTTVGYLAQFLLKVSSYSKDNMMSIQNLAMVFTPAIIRPEKQSLEYMGHVSFLTQQLSLIILNSEHVFFEIQIEDLISQRKEEQPQPLQQQPQQPQQPQKPQQPQQSQQPQQPLQQPQQPQPLQQPQQKPQQQPQPQQQQPRLSNSCQQKLSERIKGMIEKQKGITSQIQQYARTQVAEIQKNVSSIEQLLRETDQS